MKAIKSKIVYEIIEEITETTEITYYVFSKNNENMKLDNKIEEYETKSSNLNKYVTDLGSYVNRLEMRVKTLEEDGGREIFQPVRQ